MVNVTKTINSFTFFCAWEIQNWVDHMFKDNVEKGNFGKFLHYTNEICDFKTFKW